MIGFMRMLASLILGAVLAGPAVADEITAAADLANFATGGVTLLTYDVREP